MFCRMMVKEIGAVDGCNNNICAPDRNMKRHDYGFIDTYKMIIFKREYPVFIAHVKKLVVEKNASWLKKTIRRVRTKCCKQFNTVFVWVNF